MPILPILLLTLPLACAPQPAPFPISRPEATLTRGRLRLQLASNGVAELQIGPSTFARTIAPEGWEVTSKTRVQAGTMRGTIGPWTAWHARPLVWAEGRGEIYPERLEPGRALEQRFVVPDGNAFSQIEAHLPTWKTTGSAATLSLLRGDRTIASRRIESAQDNAWNALRAPEPQGPGVYTVRLSDPSGQIGWWTNEPRERHLRVDLRQRDGEGTMEVALDGAGLRLTAILRGPERSQGPFLWRWSQSWTKDGYDVTPRAGVLFSRIFTDNQRYLTVHQLKRRENAGLSFGGCRWIEVEGNQDADLRIEGENLGMQWEMEPHTMHLRVATPAGRESDAWRSTWHLAVLPRVDSLPESFPRFACSDPAATEDLNRLFWERAFSFPAPAGGAAWQEWMALMRAWYAGPARDGEIAALRDYPITAEGYVHTWGQASVGWPFPPSPPYDTRHFDTNARFLLALWRYYLWTGDRSLIAGQAGRIRRAIRYQLGPMEGERGLIRALSKDTTGRHRGVGNNYWDILPFGHLDAYANAVFVASIDAMAGLEKALGETTPSTDWAALRQKARARYDETFWDETSGRWIGCVDLDGVRHDYGFTFVNLEALFYGLGGARQAERIYRWLEQGDTYSRFVFAPRATTIHNPRWSDEAPEGDPKSPRRPWWHFDWKGTGFGEQCQDGGAILYLSFFDLMDRQRYRGADDAWKRFAQIRARYRQADRLCGGAPLIDGAIPQQEHPGQVGLDLPFPESGLAPCWFLYGVLGIDATPDGLRIAPDLPATLEWAQVSGVHWRGWTLAIRAKRGGPIVVNGRDAAGKSRRWTFRKRGVLPAGQVFSTPAP